MGLPKRLTEMQKRFAELLVFGGPDGPLTKTEAAKQAGYSEKRCRQEGSELTNPRLNPLVVKYIGELKEERLKKYEVNYASHVAELGRIKDAALKKGAWSAAVNAETNRGKAAGLYIDRKIIKNREARGPNRTRTRKQNETNFRRLLTDYRRYPRPQKDRGQQKRLISIVVFDIFVIIFSNIKLILHLKNVHNVSDFVF